jgi:hypothetical protein
VAHRNLTQSRPITPIPDISTIIKSLALGFPGNDMNTTHINAMYKIVKNEIEEALLASRLKPSPE